MLNKPIEYTYNLNYIICHKTLVRAIQSILLPHKSVMHTLEA